MSLPISCLLWHARGHNGTTVTKHDKDSTVIPKIRYLAIYEYEPHSYQTTETRINVDDEVTTYDDK